MSWFSPLLKYLLLRVFHYQLSNISVSYRKSWGYIVQQVEWWLLKRHVHVKFLEPGNVNLFGKRAFADVNTLRMSEMSSSWITRVGLVASDKCLIRADTDAEEEEAMWRWRQRLEWCWPRNTCSYLKLEIFFLRGFGGSVVLLASWCGTSEPQNYERINFCHLKPPSLW